MMKQISSKLVVALSLSALMSTAYSAPLWYFTYGAGIVMPAISRNAVVDNNSGASSPYNLDSYTRHSTNNAALLFEIGKRWVLPQSRLHAISLGLQYQYFLPTNVGKDITQYSSPEFLNYTYDLDLSANILLLNAKVELFTWKNITPFINAGAGMLQLSATDYNEYAFTGVTARTSPNFARNDQYQLTYQAGAGFNWALSPTITASINYIYHPLTSFKTKNGTGTWSNRKLDFGNAYANTVFLTVTLLQGDG